MQIETRIIEMGNGIKVTITVSDDGNITNAYMYVEEMEILVGNELNHVGGRPKKKN